MVPNLLGFLHICFICYQVHTSKDRRWCLSGKHEVFSSGASRRGTSSLFKATRLHISAARACWAVNHPEAHTLIVKRGGERQASYQALFSASGLLSSSGPLPPHALKGQKQNKTLFFRLNNKTRTQSTWDSALSRKAGLSIEHTFVKTSWRLKWAMMSCFSAFWDNKIYDFLAYNISETHQINRLWKLGCNPGGNQPGEINQFIGLNWIIFK